MPRRSSSRSTPPGEVEQRLQSLDRDGVTVTIVDTAGGVSAATNSAIRYADFCLIPTRPSIADIEATAATLSVVRAWHKPFAYRPEPDPDPRPRASPARRTRWATKPRSTRRYPCQTLHRDAQRSPGRAERRPCGLRIRTSSKSAEEIRGLWQWVEAKLRIAVTDDEELANDLSISPLATVIVEPSETAIFA